MLTIFTLLEILFALIMGLFNLFGMGSATTSIILFTINIVIFFIYGFKSGKATEKRGFIEGLITGLLMIAILFLISLILFRTAIGFGTLFYYMILLITSIISATIGKNKKENAN